MTWGSNAGRPHLVAVGRRPTADHDRDSRGLRQHEQPGNVCVPRRLLGLLDGLRRARMSMLLAPPGFGKTATLDQWRTHLDAGNVRTVWCDMGQAGRTPSGFLDLLVKSFRAGGIDIAVSGKSGKLSKSSAVENIVLAMELSSTPVVLVLDDYGAAESPANNAILLDLLESLPETAHIALSARRQPALPLSLSKVEGMVRCIGVDDLRLGNLEIAQVLGDGVPLDDVERVTDSTAGWPIAVQLYRQWFDRAKLGKGRPHAAIRGPIPAVIEYLDEQLLPLLDASMRQLLMDISVVDPIDADMVELFPGRADGSKLFWKMQEIVPGLLESLAGEDRASYRLHPLLRDYAAHLLDRKPGRRTELHSRASDWFADRYRWPEAVRHAVASADKALLDRLLKRIGPFDEYLRRGPAAVKALLNEVPAADLKGHPRLQIAASLIHFKGGFVAEARQELMGIRANTAGFTVDPAGNHQALAIEGRALELIYLAYETRQDFSTVSPLLADLRAKAAQFPVIWAVTETIEVMLAQQIGDLNDVRAALDRWGSVCDTHRLTFNRLQRQLHELLLLLSHGQLDALRSQIVRARKMRRELFGTERAVLAMCEIASITIDYERNPSEEQANALLTIVETLSFGDQFFDHLAIVYPIIAELSFQQAGLEAVERHLDRAEGRLVYRGLHHLDLLLPALRAKYHARAGRIEQATQLADRHAFADNTCAAGNRRISWREREAVTAALIHLKLASDDPNEASRLARGMIEDAVQGGRPRGHLTGLAYLCAAEIAQDDVAAACQTLEDCLALAAPQGIIAPLLEVGPLLQPAFDVLARKEGLSKTRQRQIELIGSVQSAFSGMQIDDLLNKHQLDVIRYLVDGLSNKRIAIQLDVTEHTVKFHLKKIFRRLQVGNRKEAIAAYLYHISKSRYHNEP